MVPRSQLGAVMGFVADEALQCFACGDEDWRSTRLLWPAPRCGLAGEELFLPLEGHLLKVEIGLHARELPRCHFESGLGLLHGRLSLLELRLQLRVLDHRQHLPPFHMVADIIVDL
ncbi:MAG TPA: hypothetical protein VNY06_07380 [Methylocella sp.]|nr:hypothetical protein [Methylocella sp.]